MAELRDVLSTDQLRNRRSRAPQLTMQNEALHALARSLADPPWDILQKLGESALRLCDAETTGLSLLDEPEDGRPVFRWTHMAGRLQAMAGECGPVEPSPCGYTLRLREPQLFKDPGHFFGYIAAVQPSVAELLVVPIVLDDVGVGTIWIISHRVRSYFDMEDVRVLESLAAFAAFAIRGLCRDGCLSALRTGRRLGFAAPQPPRAAA